MLFSALFTLAAAALAAAQTATTSAATSGPTCAAEAVVQSCLAGLKPRIDGCAGTDYSCLCYAYRDSATCWNNCPGDQRGYTLQQQASQYCLVASQYPSTSTTMTSASATGSGAGSTGMGSTAAMTMGSMATGTTSGGSASAFATGSSTSSSAGAAGGMATPVVGVVGVLLGAVALL